MWYETILSAVVSVVISFPLGMFFERRKKTAEARGSELDNVEKELELYRMMLDDARKMIEMLQRRGDSMEEKVNKLRLENQRLKEELKQKGHD